MLNEMSDWEDGENVPVAVSVSEATSTIKVSARRALSGTVYAQR